MRQAKGYAVAFASVIAAWLAREALVPSWGPTRFPFIFFFPAVALTAWVGGIRPAVLAVFLSVGTVAFFFVDPRHSLSVAEFSELGGLVTFAGVSFCIALAIETIHRANARAEESERRFRLLVSDVREYAIFMLDGDGRVANWNVGAERTMGYEASDVMGRHFSKFYSPEEVAAGKPDEALRTAVLTGRFEDEGRRVRRDGSRYWASTAVTAIREESGQLTGYSVVIRDLTRRRQAEEALRESEARFSGIINSAMDAVIAVDRQQKIVLFNPAAEAMFGCASADAIGRSLDQFIPARFCEAHRGHVEAFGRTGTSARRMGALGTVSGLRADGEEFPIEASISQVEVRNEKLFTVILRDITERQRSEEALRQSRQHLATEVERLEHLQQVSNQLIGIGDAQALYEKILDTAIAMMRSDFASIQMLDLQGGGGGQLRLLGHRGFTPEAAKRWEWVKLDSSTTCGEAFRKGSRVIVSNVSKCDYIIANGELETFLQTGIRAVQSTPLYSRSGTMLGIISTHWREPYEPDEGEIRLLDILARLVADLIERTRAEEALREADRRKDEFLLMLGHELRNPLGVISTVVQALGLERPSDAKLEEHRATIADEIEQMRQLLDDLLDVSRIGRGMVRLRSQRCDLAVIVRKSVEGHRALVAEAGLALSTEIPQSPVWVIGDETRLAQVVANLLYNAAKYTDAGGQVTVRLDEDSSRKAALLTVRDTGVGIAPDFLERIFEPLVQVEKSLHRSRGGLGLGLALVKGLVRLHDGEVWASSKGPGHGSEFTVRLPLAGS